MLKEGMIFDELHARELAALYESAIVEVRFDLLTYLQRAILCASLCGARPLCPLVPIVIVVIVVVAVVVVVVVSSKPARLSRCRPASDPYDPDRWGLCPHRCRTQDDIALQSTVRSCSRMTS